MESRLINRYLKVAIPRAALRPLSSRKVGGSGVRRSDLLLSRAGVTADRAALDITKMEPLGDRILVNPFETEQTTEGGILLASSAADTGRDAQFGEVLSVGDDVKLKLSKGDKVVFNMFSSATVEVSDGEIVFVHDKNILATLN